MICQQMIQNLTTILPPHPNEVKFSAIPAKSGTPITSMESQADSTALGIPLLNEITSSANDKSPKGKNIFPP